MKRLFNRDGVIDSKSVKQCHNPCPFGPDLVVKWNEVQITDFGIRLPDQSPSAFQKSITYFPKSLGTGFSAGCNIGFQSGEFPAFRDLVEKRIVVKNGNSDEFTIGEFTRLISSIKSPKATGIPS